MEVGEESEEEDSDEDYTSISEGNESGTVHLIKAHYHNMAGKVQEIKLHLHQCGYSHFNTSLTSVGVSQKEDH